MLIVSGNEDSGFVGICNRRMISKEVRRKHVEDFSVGVLLI